MYINSQIFIVFTVLKQLETYFLVIILKFYDWKIAHVKTVLLLHDVTYRIKVMNSAIYIDISWSIHLNKHDEGSPQMTVNCSWPWSYVNIFLMIKYLIFEILPSEKHCCCKVVLLCCPLVNFLFENFALEILWTNEWNENDAMMRFPVFLLNQHYPIHGN